MRRFKTLTKRTRDLLAGGEQAHVEFKTEVPSSIAEQAAAGANYVALNPEVEVHTILLGVAEERLENGVTRGKPVGCLDDSSRVEDLDQLRLRVEQKIRDAVVPPPHVTISEEMTGTSTPILVVEVRPASPPHRVGPKYVVRGTAGVQALTQHDALAIFRAARTQAWIDEVGASTPLMNALQALQSGYEDIAFRVSDAFLGDRGDGDELRDLERHLEESDRWKSRAALEVQEALDEVRNELYALDDVKDRVGELADAALLTPEQVRWKLRESRERLWLQLNHHAGLDPAFEKEVAVVVRLVHDYLSVEPRVDQYAENHAELGGYSILFPEHSEIPAHRELSCSFVSAVLARASGVPSRFSPDWIHQGVKARADIAEEVSSMIKHPTRTRTWRPRKPLAREVAIIEVNSEGASALALDPRAVRVSANLSVWETSEGEFRLAWKDGVQTVPVIYQPRWGRDSRRRPGKSTTVVSKQFRLAAENVGGVVHLLDGSGQVLGGHHASP
ncbi:AlbA family DNA-binding domain-containing protein [Knoellia locipacati]|uniref:AlbA family DNA-binding domain-containing protein n=1 Tax=Knoellia locipacati TaxID=882824 RepID=UPI0011BD74DA|nr:hypothetical protein [Knoellia locipacati]